MVVRKGLRWGRTLARSAWVMPVRDDCPANGEGGDNGARTSLNLKGGPERCLIGTLIVKTDGGKRRPLGRRLVEGNPR